MNKEKICKCGFITERDKYRDTENFICEECEKQEGGLK